MKAGIQIISPPTKKSHSSFLISFDSGSYLFNVGEGTQRIIQQNKVKLGKLRSIFLNRMEWDYLGGLPGMILTISDASLGKVNLVGPSKILDFLSANRQFVARPNLSISVRQIWDKQQVCYEDENLKVTCSPILHKDVSMQDYIVSLKSDSMSVPKKRRLLSTMFNYQDNDQVPSFSNALSMREQKIQPNCLVYLCEGPEIPGKMDGKKAAELGVLPKDRGKLIKGDSVMSKFGTLVHPSDCVSPARLGSKVIVFDCPDVNYLDAMITNSLVAQQLNDKTNPPKVLIHQVGLEVLRHPKFVTWVQQWSESTQHVLLCAGLHSHEKIYTSSNQLLELLSQIDPELFSGEAMEPAPESVPPTMDSNRFQIGTPYTMVEFEPNLKVEVTKPPVSSSIPMDIDSIASAVAQYQSEFDTKVPDYPYVLPLGTASCLPSKHRNVSSNYVRMESGSILLDVGEGTLGQLNRYFGLRINEELNQLQLIFISHLHADHHLGAFGIFKAWNEATRGLPDKKLYVVAPHIYIQWMSEYAEIENIGLDRIVLLECSGLITHDLDAVALKKSLGLRSIRTVPVLHCYQSYALVLQHQSSFKLSYSGDCRPSEELIIAGSGSDLLIHEATFEDELHHEAMEKNHSTIGEAIAVGTKMGAKNVLLTHFSQRYPINVPLPQIPAEGPNIACAFDLMKIRLGEFSKFRRLSPILQNFLINPS
jgi:ribonuclease Z